MTGVIVEHPAVEFYCAADVDRAPLDLLAARLRRTPRERFTFTLVEGTVDDVPLDRQFDAVILMSTVHQIADRDHLFAAIRTRLRATGRILAIDPTHYLHRWRQLWREARTRGYLAKAFSDARNGQLRTQAMCQLAEYRAIARATGLHVSRVRLNGVPRKMRWLRSWGVPLGPLARWSAREILVECEPAPFPPPTTWAQALAPARWTIVIASLLRR